LDEELVSPGGTRLAAAVDGVDGQDIQTRAGWSEHDGPSGGTGGDGDGRGRRVPAVDVANDVLATLARGLAERECPGEPRFAHRRTAVDGGRIAFAIHGAGARRYRGDVRQ